MKKYLIISAVLSLAFVSCNKEVKTADAEPQEIVFDLGGEFASVVETKTTAINNVSGLGTVYCLCYDGSSTVWNIALSKSGDTYYTGRYWPNSNSPGYRFYAANVEMPGVDRVNVPNFDTDILCEYLGSPTVRSNNTLYLDHIFSRIGSLTLNTPSGYELIGSWSASVSYGCPASGCYYTISSGSFTTTTTTSTAIYSSNDIWTLPGSATITVSYRLRKGAWDSDTIVKSSTVTLAQGCVNNISGTLPGPDTPPTDITFSVNVAAWGTNNIGSISFN